PAHFTSDSVRGVKLTTPTGCYQRCAFSSADTWKNPTTRPRWLRNMTANNSHSDALVFFGATGDLAYKKIFPALQAMLKRGHLNVPVIAVAKENWSIEQLRTRAHDSLVEHGGLDPAAFAKLSGLLRYVGGDYSDPATFQALKKALAGAKQPAHYLAIPPVLFGTVVEQLS